MNDAARIDRWRSVRRVLAVRLDNLGDVLMTTPALAAIRRSVPDAQLSLLTSPAAAGLARHLPDVDEVIVFDAPWVKGSSQGRAALPIPAEQRLLEQVTHERFDAAVIFTVCTQSALPAALWCRTAGIGLRLAHCRENPYDLLTDWVPDPDRVATGMRHEVARQLALLQHVGWRTDDERLRLDVTPAQRARVRWLLSEAGVPAQRPFFVVHPGASAPSRRYPAKRFGIAADAIAIGSGCLPVFTGEAGEQGLIDAARCAMTQPSIALAGRLDVTELAALIAEARLLVTNNTGPAHIAAATATPVAVLYALTNPQHTPWRARARVLSHDVPCRHCLKSLCPEGHHDCLNKIEPADVAEAGLALLRETAPTSRPVQSPTGGRRAMPATQGTIA